MKKRCTIYAPTNAETNLYPFYSSKALPCKRGEYTSWFWAIIVSDPAIVWMISFTLVSRTRAY
jgi:hypothetical protein